MIEKFLAQELDKEINDIDNTLVRMALRGEDLGKKAQNIFD